MNVHPFLISTKKESKYTANLIDMLTLCITIHRSIKCTSKSQFQNDVRQSHNASVKLKYCTCKSQCSCYMGNHRIVRIVGLIHIHVASLKSVWLPMLHNHVCLLQVAFIHPFYSIVESYSSIYICWNGFQSPSPGICGHHPGHSTQHPQCTSHLELI